jgi:hypothetical protein
MFNKKPFNKKDGETRVCKGCGVTYHTMKARNLCKACVNAQTRLKRNIAVGKEVTDGYAERNGRPRDLEGIDYEDRRREWYKKSRWLEKELKERSQWQAFFRDEFERIRKDEKLWNSLTRETLGMSPKKSEQQEGNVGRPLGSVGQNKKYPDTRNMSWYDYEAGGWGEPEDS